MTISPCCAYWTILRAISEIAVAISVSVPPLKPISAAKARPRCLASTMSASELIRTLTSSGTSRPPFCPLLQVSQSLFEVQRRGHVFQRQPELNHRKCDLRLNADDHRLRAAKFHHIGDHAHRPGGERIHHIQHRDVDDHPP